MPRANSRKRNNHRNATALRLPAAASNLSANAPEFVPLNQFNIVNNENNANQRENSAVQPMALDGCSSEPNSSRNDNNSEATRNISSLPNPISNSGQRDLLINLLNNSKVDCVICYELTKNVEPIWNCRNCFQIMHLKCVMVWFIKSHRDALWRCPACQNEVVGKPNYVCFCGSLPNPFFNNVDTPHSCGQVCGLQKKNALAEFNDCHHKCTLLCHPGPCPRCVVQVLRKCGCGKTKSYAQCGQSNPIICQNICSKTLNCNNHICEKQCHSDECGPCKEHCQQENLDDECVNFMEALARRNQVGVRIPLVDVLTTSALVSEDELRMLGLNPDELLNRSDEENTTYDYDMDFRDDDEDDDDDDDDDDDELIEDIINDDMNEILWSESNASNFIGFPFATVFSVNGFRANISSVNNSDSNSSNSDNDEPVRTRNSRARPFIATSRNGLFLVGSDSSDDVDVGDTSVPSNSSSSSSSSSSNSSSGTSNDSDDDLDCIVTPIRSDESNHSWNINFDDNESDDESYQGHSYSEDSNNSSHHSNINGVDESIDSFGGFDTSNSSV